MFNFVFLQGIVAIQITKLPFKFAAKFTEITSETFKLVNPFSTNVPFLYPLKISENLRFSDVFRGYRSVTLVENGLINHLIQIFNIVKVLLQTLVLT